MFNRTVGVAFVFALMAFTSQKVYGDVNDLAAESLKVYKKVEAITAEMKAATSDLSNRLRDVRYRLKWFKEPAFDDKKVKYDLDNINQYKRWIATREAYIELAKITDANERAELLEKYDADRKRLLAEELAAGRPFRKKIELLKEEVKDKEAAFDKAMKSYCLLPGQNYPAVAGTSAVALYHAGRLTYKWLDTDSKQLALAWITLKDKPVVKENAEMLDGTFYVSDHWPTNIMVWAGYFRINLVPQKPEWQGREKIAKIVKDFIDLKGLAKIDASRNDSTLNALAMGSLACSKKYAAIVSERREATKQLLAGRLKVKALIGRLRKPPADSDQLKRDRQTIVRYEEELELGQTRLDIGRITDPNKRAAMMRNLEAERKKLDAAKRKIAKPYDDKMKKLKSGLKIKEAALNEAMKRYCLTGGKAYPGATEISIKTTFYEGRTRFIWKDADGKWLCSALLELRNRPVIPKDARMLDGLYYVSSSALHLNFIEVWVGNFHISFGVQKKEWLGKEKVAEVLKQFVDLKGLAKINVTREVKCES